MTVAKRCGGECGKELPATAEYFAKDVSRNDGFCRLCRPCSRAVNARWRKNNPEKLKARRKKYKNENKEHIRLWRKAYRQNPKNNEKLRQRDRDAKFRRAYGITLGERIAMTHNQKGLCAWCEKPLPNEGLAGGGCAVDHCHDTGVIRGIVHLRCNLDIGALERERLRHPDPIAHLIEYNLRAKLRGAL